MSALAALFLDNLLPVFLATATGYVLGKWAHVDPRALSRAVFYIFSPCLVFTLLLNSPLEGSDFIRMMAFAVALLAVVGGLTWLLNQALGLDRRLSIAVLLTSMFMNAGNFGLSVNLFAFGEEALAQASLFFVTTAALAYTVGVILASMGAYSPAQALKSMLRLPFLYALALAFLFARMQWRLPLPLDRTVTLLSEAAIPVMLVLLGIQLQRARWQGRRRALALTNSLRLVASPLIALGLSVLFGFQGSARQAGVLEAGMPSAVMATVLATEYDLEPSFVTMAVFTSTVLSPLTLTPLLAILRG